MKIALLILIPLLVLGIALAGTHILVERLFILMVLVIFLSTIFALLGLRNLKGHFNNPGEHHQAGQSFRVEAVVENNSSIPKSFLKMMIKTNQSSKYKNIHINLPARKAYSWQADFTYPQRGHYKLGPLVAEAGDPFGLIRLRRKLDSEKDIFIYPSIVELPNFRAESALLQNRLPTNEMSGIISGIREYVPGDSFNRIHWRSTAHTGKIFVKEFELDLSERIWVILDLDQNTKFGSGIESTEEYGITIAASIVKKYSDTGRPVGLIAQGKEQYFYPARPGHLNMWHIMEVLAGLQANGQIPIGQILESTYKKITGNSVAIVVTSNTNVDMVNSLISPKKQGFQIVTILLDSSSFGGHSSPQEAFARLRAANIPTYIVKKGDSLSKTLSSNASDLPAKSSSKISESHKTKPTKMSAL